MSLELPVLQPVQRERADAARNRERILCAARRLMLERGPEGVSMDCVAETAGVGKGTLYRRFGDRNGLLRALVEEDEIRFQDEIIRGLPPLGPGAPAAERLHAFGDALLELVFERAAFFTGDPSHTGGPAQFYKLHIDLLLRDAVGSHPQADYLADVLLVCVLGPQILVQQRKGMTLEELRAGWHTLVDAILAAAGATGGTRPPVVPA